MNKKDAKYCYELKVFEQSPEIIGYVNKTFYTNDVRKLIKFGGRLNPCYKGKVTGEELRSAGLSNGWINILFKDLNKEDLK